MKRSACQPSSLARLVFQPYNRSYKLLAILPIYPFPTIQYRFVSFYCSCREQRFFVSVSHQTSVWLCTRFSRCVCVSACKQNISKLIHGSSQKFIAATCYIKASSPILDYQLLGSELIPVSWQSTRRRLCHKPGGRLPLLSTRPMVTFPAKEITTLIGTKLYCLLTGAHRCK